MDRGTALLGWSTGVREQSLYLEVSLRQTLPAPCYGGCRALLLGAGLAQVSAEATGVLVGFLLLSTIPPAIPSSLLLPA